ncbi:uncharacterized protein LOC134812686 [Bolinopsis microptera]|uniref:uncharacterized protein LOC134812686 n=1 Tax=Bolinopsis microptera TaxID=2820187 RepID=UPI00307A16E4
MSEPYTTSDDEPEDSLAGNPGNAGNAGNAGNTNNSPPELVYTKEGFEDFLQQSELSGISRDRQDELISLFLAQDIPLETIILDTIQRTIELLRRNKLRVVVLVVVLGLLGFVVVNEFRARRGYQDYQPWQFEMSALLRHWQLSCLGWFDWNVLFNRECYLDNPYYFFTHPNDAPEIDCENAARELTFSYASSYTGIFNSKKFPLPLVLNEAQEGWSIRANFTLDDLHKILSVNPDKNYPCVNYMGDAQAGPDCSRDPLRALIDGQLAKEDGTPLHLIFMDGCTRPSNKILRGLTKRPIFLDPHIESLQSVKAITAKGIPKGTSAKVTVRLYDQDGQRDQEYGFTWLAQVIGTSTITVRDLDCPQNKPNIYTMQPGDIVSIGPEDSLELAIPGPEESFLLYTNFKVKP